MAVVRNAAPAQGLPGSDNAALGVLLTVISVAIFSVQDMVAKILVQDYHPFQITMMRYWAFGLFALLLVLRTTPLKQALASKVPKRQIVRGLLLVADVWLFALAVRTVPLAELQSIGLLYPLLVTMLAIPLLGERVGPFRIAAVVAGFAGTLIILRPGGLPLTLDVMYALGTTLVFSLYVIMTRQVSRFDSPATNMLYAGVVGVVMTSSVGFFFWSPLTLEAMMLVGVVMATMVSAHYLMILALSMAPASVLQPFNFLALPFAIFWGATAFGQLIDPISLGGALLIVTAGLVVWWRERQKKPRI